MSDLRQVLATRIKDLRRKMALTQEELAREAGFPAHQTISEIERGGRDVKAWELAKIAKALQTEVQYLIAETEPARPSVLWRDYPGTPASAQEARFLKRCQQYAELELLLGEKPSRDLPRMEFEPESSTYGDVQLAASEVGKALGLGSRPSSSLETILEGNYAVKIWYEDLGAAGSAASAIGEFGYGILMHREQAPWRRNFSFAHVLFHLVTREGLTQEALGKNQWLIEKVEKLAQEFAASLLLPADVLQAEFDRLVVGGKVSYGDLISLARDFDVSTQALLWRLVHCRRLQEAAVQKVLDDPAFRKADRDTMAGHWRDPSPLPERFVRLAFRAYKKGLVSRSRLAELLETSLIDLPAMLAEYGFEENDEYEAEALLA
jgi:XRE family transcriptional regulator, fatty acid utilization regulator